MEITFRFKGFTIVSSVEALCIAGKFVWGWRWGMMPYIIGALAVVVFVRELKRKPIPKSSALATHLKEAWRSVWGGDSDGPLYWREEVRIRGEEFEADMTSEKAQKALSAIGRFAKAYQSWFHKQTWRWALKAAASHHKLCWDDFPRE